MSWPTSDANRGRPLAGVKVLDLTRVLAGPFAAMLLADLGADVIKVEAPNGDETRRWGPPFFQGTAAYYFGANRNKWSVALDLSAGADRAALAGLIGEADVVVQNFALATATKLGVDHRTVAALNPRAIYLALGAFGPEQADRPGYDLVMQALSGMMAITGDAAGEPAKVGVPISDLAAALYATVAITSALFARERTGQTPRIDISLYDSVIALLANQSMSWLLCDTDTPRLGTDHPVLAPYGAYKTATGSIVLAVGSDEQFAKLCEALARRELARDPRFVRNRDRVTHRIELRAALQVALTARGSAEWSELLGDAGVPNALIRGVGEALDAPETATVTTVEHPTWGTVAQVMGPIRFDGQYLRPYLAPPTLGEHTAVVIPSASRAAQPKRDR